MAQNVQSPNASRTFQWRRQSVDESPLGIAASYSSSEIVVPLLLLRAKLANLSLESESRSQWLLELKSCHSFELFHTTGGECFGAFKRSALLGLAMRSDPFLLLPRTAWLYVFQDWLTLSGAASFTNGFSQRDGVHRVSELQRRGLDRRGDPRCLFFAKKARR